MGASTRPSTMSIKCQGWVYEYSEATGNDRLVLLAIADEANDDGTSGHPSVDTIAHKARLNKRTALRCIERLESAGALLVERPEIRGRGRYNKYVVVMATNGDTLTPIPDPPEMVRNGDRKVRNGASPYVNGSRPTDPLTHRPEVTDYFAAFWKVYPRKASKGEARKAWTKALKAVDGDADRIVQGAYRYRHDPNRLDEFTKYPGPWLNAEGWEDDPLPSRSNGVARPSKLQSTFDTIDSVFDQIARGNQ